MTEEGLAAQSGRASTILQQRGLAVPRCKDDW